MSRTVTVQESRPYDYLYDATTVHAGGGGGGGGGVKRVAVANNLFSVLPHYPTSTLVATQPSPVVTTLAAQASRTSSAAHAGATRRTSFPTPPLEALVHGSQRYKYFKRPYVTAVDAALAGVKLDRTAVEGAMGAGQAAASTTTVVAPLVGRRGAVEGKGEEEEGAVHNADGTRTVAVQTMYRDSATQTVPYTPDYVLPAGTTKPPEVLKLAGLTSLGPPGASLPIGQAEVETITLARTKARIEASLPPTTDEASFALRKRLMEAVEMANWRARESEIDTAAAARLAEVEAKVKEREAEREFISEQRVEELRRRLEEQREADMAALAAKRVKLLRKLGKGRKEEEMHIDMLTGTGAFVGVSNGAGGGLGRGRKATRDIIGEYADYGSRVYAPVLRDGRFPDKLKAAATRELHAPELASSHGLLDLASHLPPRALHIHIGPPRLDRQTSSKARAAEAVATDLERVHDAIQTLKAGRSTVAVENEKVPAWRKPKVVIIRPPTPTYDNEAETGEEMELESAVLLLQTLLRGRAVQNVMLEGKERRLELIQEMRADLLTHEAAAAIEAEEAVHRAAEEAAVAQAAVTEEAVGEVAASALDYFSQELVRSREMARLTALAAAADAERQRREDAETARRHNEAVAAAKAAAVKAALDAMHSAAATTLVDSLVSRAIHTAATREAGLQAYLHHVVVGPMVNRLEEQAQQQRAAAGGEGKEETTGGAAIVADLLHAVVVPTVNRELAALADTRHAAQYVVAAEEGVAIAVAAANAVLQGRAADVSSAVAGAAV